MEKINSANMRSLHDIAIERERLRYMALRYELDVSKKLSHARNHFTFPNLLSETRSFLYNYFMQTLSSWLR